MSQGCIEWIGTGSGLNPLLGNTSFLVTSKRSPNRTILVDCGFTVPMNLIKYSRLGEITDIIITHMHADHIGGLEVLGFTNYFVSKKRKDARPNLYLGTEEFAHILWEHSLKGGMEKIMSDDNLPIDLCLEDYFKVHTSSVIEIPGFPKIWLYRAGHVPGMENYAVNIGYRVLYSGDTIELPKVNANLIFQDCQFFEASSDVHISYDKLKRELPADIRRRTYLVHLGNGWKKKKPVADGFGGFVMPGDRFGFGM